MKTIKAIREWFRGKKTYLLAIETVIEILVAFLSGDQTIFNFIMSEEWIALKTALGIIFIRAGFSNERLRLKNGKEPA